MIDIALLITSDIVLPHALPPPFHTSTIVSSFTLSLLSNTSCHTATKIDDRHIHSTTPTVLYLDGPLTDIAVLCRIGLDNVQQFVDELGLEGTEIPLMILLNIGRR